MKIDELDIKILKENFDDDMINELDIDNTTKIFFYLIENNIYYAKDLFLESLDLFLRPFEEFVKKFEKLKNILGPDFADKLGDDSSLIELMYKD